MPVIILKRSSNVSSRNSVQNFPIPDAAGYTAIMLALSMRLACVSLLSVSVVTTSVFIFFFWFCNQRDVKFTIRIETNLGKHIRHTYVPVLHNKEGLFALLCRWTYYTVWYIFCLLPPLLRTKYTTLVGFVCLITIYQLSKSSFLF